MHLLITYFVHLLIVFLLHSLPLFSVFSAPLSLPPSPLCCFLSPDVGEYFTTRPVRFTQGQLNILSLCCGADGKFMAELEGRI